LHDGDHVPAEHSDSWVQQRGSRGWGAAGGPYCTRGDPSATEDELELGCHSNEVIAMHDEVR